MEKDLRYQKAEERIIAAFIALIKEKGFSKVTVSNITKCAHVNRSTFYAHYLDKYDLLETLEQEILENIYQIMNEIKFTNRDNQDAIDELVSGFKKMANYIYSQREIIKALLSTNGDGNFQEYLKNSIVEENKKIREKNNLVFQNILPSDYTEELIINSMLDLVLFWIKKDKPESPAEFAKILTTYRQLLPFQLLKKD